MQIVSLGCPICGGPIPKEFLEKDMFHCSYCNSSLKYKGNDIIIKEKKTKPLYPAMSIVSFEGVILIKTKEIKYKGCPICFKKAGLCDHNDYDENKPINLYWREYLVSTKEDERKILCGPMRKELMNLESYVFDAVVNRDGIYQITGIDEQVIKRGELKRKIDEARERLNGRIWEIKKR